MVPDDHPYSYLTMRSTAFRDADLIIVLGTRMNYIIGHAAPPRFGAQCQDRPHRDRCRGAGMSARNVDILHRRRLQIGAAATDRRAAGEGDRRQIHRLAQDALHDGEAAKRSGPGEAITATDRRRSTRSGSWKK